MHDNKAQALRKNEGKAKLTYLLEAPDAIQGFARVMESSESKYPRKNWRKGRDIRDTMDSLLRHATALLNGELADPESGLPHVDHVLANAVIAAQNFHEYKHLRVLLCTDADQDDLTAPQEKNKTIPLVLEVGKKYAMRNGRTATITAKMHETCDGDFSGVTMNGALAPIPMQLVWNADGTNTVLSDYDLISEIE